MLEIQAFEQRLIFFYKKLLKFYLTKHFIDCIMNYERQKTDAG